MTIAEREPVSPATLLRLGRVLIRTTGLLPETLNDAGMNALPKWRASRKSFALFARTCRRR